VRSIEAETKEEPCTEEPSRQREQATTNNQEEIPRPRNGSTKVKERRRKLSCGAPKQQETRRCPAPRSPQDGGNKQQQLPMGKKYWGQRMGARMPRNREEAEVACGAWISKK
jgi:hypothetical protein